MFAWFTLCNIFVSKVTYILPDVGQSFHICADGTVVTVQLSIEAEPAFQTLPLPILDAVQCTSVLALLSAFSATQVT